MARKKSEKQLTGTGLPPGISADDASRAREKDMRNIQRVMAQQRFKTRKEAEEFMAKYINGKEPPKLIPETSQDKAQDMIYDAYLVANKKERVKIAREALKLCPECADAYVLLAEEAQNVEEACLLYQKGVEAGERTLGESAFQEKAGLFWVDIETRPYMRARAGLAECLWQTDRTEEAVQHYWELLRLNPADNQNIRESLAYSLLIMGKQADLKKLLDMYKEDESAVWLYTQALAAYLDKGDNKRSRSLLMNAIEHNPFIPMALLGLMKLPNKLPDYFTPGDEDEAMLYLAMFGNIWLDHIDAIEWLVVVIVDEIPAVPGTSQPSPPKSGIPPVFLDAFKAENKYRKTSQKATSIYTFKVALKGVPGIWRKIEIKGNQTLHDLHESIFDAFERYDEHLYAFFLSNKIWDKESEYGLPSEDSYARDATRTRIDKLGLALKQKFLYVFDFGDQWEHTITLVNIKEEKPTGDYPRVTDSKGEAPPQYPDYDEDEEEE
jgi:tetratricopeptide (TPR) repeat protein